MGKSSLRRRGSWLRRGLSDVFGKFYIVNCH